jgi:hypothetical protein
MTWAWSERVNFDDWPNREKEKSYAIWTPGPGQFVPVPPPSRPLLSALGRVVPETQVRQGPSSKSRV